MAKMTAEEKRIKKKIYNQIYNSDPVNQAKKNEHAAQYRSRPEVIYRMKKWRESNPNYQIEYNIKYRVKRREKKLKSSYGLSVEGYEDLWKKQKGVCAICPKRLMKGILGLPGGGNQIDHNHGTKKVRGILCRSCNLLLGFACENEKILLSAIKYLKKYG